MQSRAYTQLHGNLLVCETLARESVADIYCVPVFVYFVFT